MLLRREKGSVHNRKEKTESEETVLLLLQSSEAGINLGILKRGTAVENLKNTIAILINQFRFNFPIPLPRSGTIQSHCVWLLGNFLSTLWKPLAFRNGQADLNQKLDKIQNCDND